MYMSDDEIAGKFRRAEDKREMLQILADLNGCSTESMKAYLLEHGFAEEDMPAKRGRRKRMAKLETAEQTQEEQARIVPGIPAPVRKAITDRIDFLTDKAKEIEQERECLLDYLKGGETG